jgi:ubiquinone/menaquinone biosynthesis C-methylase UbiE
MMKLARKYQDLGVEGAKARQYDTFSRRYRMGDFAAYAALAASQVGPGASVLEVACGPGYFCTELAKLGDYRITGLDISHDLVGIADENASRAGADVTFVEGNASALPFPDETFDLVFCSWAVKNFMEPAKVFSEMHRVLKAGGAALIVDLNHNASDRDWKRYAADRGLAGMTALTMRLAFLIQRSGAYSASELEALVKDSPFDVRVVGTENINLVMSLVK